MKKKLLFLIFLVGALALPRVTLALVTITDMVENVAKIAWVIATVIVIVFWVVTGILFLSSMGDPSKLATAKKSLFFSIGGTVLVILAYSVLAIIENAILKGI